MRVGPLVLCLPLLSAASGCGFFLVHGPPTGHEQMAYISCTENDAGAILDAVWGGLNVLTLFAIASSPDVHDGAPEVFIATGLGYGVIMAFSASSGFKKVAACQRARQALEQRLQAARGVETVPVADSARVLTVVISPGADTLAVGAQLQLVASAHNSSGAMVADRRFTWSSSNDAIASVSDAGLVTAHAPGSVVIAANTNNVVGIAAILVSGGPR